MPVEKVLKEKVPVKIWTNKVEPEAEQQLRNVASLPFVFKHVAVMPDVHWGMGATVGSVVATKGAVIPAAVGVDIGCGMVAAKLKNIRADQVTEKIKDLRRGIEREIPVGFNENEIVEDSVYQWKKWNDFEALHPKAHTLKQKAMRQLGSLGGGNHFIEISLDTENHVWVVLHSGSRHLGKSIADIYIHDAKNMMKKMAVSLPDPNLAYFTQKTKDYRHYMHDLHFCQEYAYKNREIMMQRILRLIGRILNTAPEVDLQVNCHHNFAVEEEHFGEKVLVTRKGAVRAGKGDLGIVPGSMGTATYIVRGLGNKDSFESCAHGAGRQMSRKQAKRQFSIEDLERQTSGVECRKDKGVLDEIPSAYKNINEVMKHQNDLVEVVATLKQILCVKG